MKRVAVCNLSRAVELPLHARYCSSFTCRLRGYTFRRHIPQTEGLLLVQSSDSRIDSSIHMLFCFTAMAVVWINNDLSVVDVRLAKPWRPAYFSKAPARYILEINPVRGQDFIIGDKVRFEEI